jgi:hypothetical protein
MCIVYGTRLPAGMFIPSLAGALPATSSSNNSNIICFPQLGPLSVA